MRIDEARNRAADWVRSYAAGSGVRAAFWSGSTIDAAPDDELAPESDLDVVLVTALNRPERLGKVDAGGVWLDVSYLHPDALADPARVARTFYLAPSFRRDTAVLDEDAQLARVREHVRRVFADPEVVRARYGDVLDRLDRTHAGIDAAPSWAERLLRGVFTLSLPTQVLLVAGLGQPTVRRRYSAVRELLGHRGMAEVYPVLLAYLGADRLTPDHVMAQLARLPAVFAAAAEVNQARGAASDIGPAGRQAAIGGAERLVGAGEHREAVFWLVVTLLRCQLVLDADAAPEIAERHRPVVVGAVAALTGLRTAGDLTTRTASLARARPWLVDTAERLVGG